MNEARYFALIVLLTAAVGLVAVLSNRLTERLRVPVPVPLLVLVLVASAVDVYRPCSGARLPAAAPPFWRASPAPTTRLASPSCLPSSLLTVNLDELTLPDVWVPGLLLALAVAIVVRPIGVGVCLLLARLQRNENAFILFAGLKGAMLLLLAQLMLAAGVPNAERLYGIVVVIIFSVLVQGSLTPVVATLLKLPMRVVEPEPWSIGVRLADEPQDVHRYTIRPGAPADGRTIAELEELPDESWISFRVRGLLQARGVTRLHAGDRDPRAQRR